MNINKIYSEYTLNSIWCCVICYYSNASVFDVTNSNIFDTHCVCFDTNSDRIENIDKLYFGEDY